MKEHKKKAFSNKSRNHAPKSAKKSLEAKTSGSFVVEGLSAVLEYLKYKRESIDFIVYKGSRPPSELKEFDSFLGKEKLIPASQYDLDQNEGSEFVSHSPLWASVRIKTKEEEELYRDLAHIKGASVLCLDHITDPRNLGAILRTAAFYGIKHVVAPKNRQVLLTGSSVATAQGAFALVDLVVVTNLSRVIEELKKRSFWVLGTSLKGKPLEEIKVSLAEENLVFVLGSEEKGLSHGIEKSCDWLVFLDGAEVALDSLNVSVAAGIFCDRIHQMRKNALKNT
jgi:23S rRNA (guanosine2251-2'-O)-methyltransferase